jgi:hypothetical protein
MFDTPKSDRVKKVKPIRGVKPLHIIGVDFGKAQDPTAVAYVQAQPVHRLIHEPTSGRKFIEATLMYSCLDLQREPLGTLYNQVIHRLADRCVKLGSRHGNFTLAADIVGPGNSAIDFLVPEYRRLAKGTPSYMRPAWIYTVGGSTMASNHNGMITVGRSVIVHTARAVIEDARYAVAPLPLRPELQGEMRVFHVKKTAAGNERYEHYRDSDHDDLLTSAVLLPVWAFENYIMPGVRAKYNPERSTPQHLMYDPELDAPGPLVTRGVQKVTLCGGSTESGNWLDKIMEDTPTSGSGTWGTEEYGYCQVWFHYADTGEAD